jgi:Transposase, Mutator family
MAAELGHPQGVTSPPGPGSARQAINEMIDAGLLDALMDRVDAGELTLTGQGGFLSEMVKAVLERGLAAELTGHLGYERGDPAGRGWPNSRNGSTPKPSRPRSATFLWTPRGTGPAASSRGWSPRAPAAPAVSTT